MPTLLLSMMLPLWAATAGVDAARFAAVEAAVRQKHTEYVLDRVDVQFLDRARNVYVAYAEIERQWWGWFEVVGVSGNTITWTAQYAAADDAPIEQSQRSAARILPQTANPIIEVWGMSHMGNGSLYLYELRGRTLHLLLETRAVDQHRDLTLIRDGKLTLTYGDLNGDGATDITLMGTIDEFDDGGPCDAPPIRSTPCRKVFFWRDGRFIEDTTQRRGFEMYFGGE